MINIGTKKSEVASVYFPEGFKASEGLLLGFNISEFTIVVLDVLPIPKNKPFKI